MKKTLIAALAFVFMMMIGTASAIEVDLIADGGSFATAFDAGDVEVTSDGTNLTVTITVNQAVNPWELVESHVHVAADAADVPQKNGNPRPGKFDYADSDPEATTVTPTVHEYEIPLGAIDDEEPFVVAVHVAIEWLDEGESAETFDDTLYEESGWGEGPDFDGKNWAMYILVEPVE